MNGESWGSFGINLASHVAARCSRLANFAFCVVLCESTAVICIALSAIIYEIFTNEIEPKSVIFKIKVMVKKDETNLRHSNRHVRFYFGDFIHIHFHQYSRECGSWRKAKYAIHCRCVLKLAEKS